MPSTENSRDAPGAMIVCLCLALSDRAIRASIAAGALTLGEVAAACRAGTGCGSCVPDLERMIGEAGMAVAASQQ
jgi:bacterioferritin-associated ferredoxin